MKKTCLLLLVFGAVQQLSAQVAFANPSGRIDKTTLPINFANNSVTLRILGSGSLDWTAGIEILGTSSPKVEVTDLAYDQHASRNPGLGLLGGNPVGSDRLSTQGNVITISPALGPSGASVIRVIVPLPGTLNIESPGGTAVLPFRSNLMVRNGIVLPEEFKGFEKLVSIALLSDVLESNPSPPAGPVLEGGQYKVTWPALRDHLITYTQIQPVVKTGAAQVMTLQLRIDEQGSVTDVNGLPPDRVNFASTLKAWKFAPFKVDGKMIPVNASVPVIVWPSGRVTAAAVPSSRRCCSDSR
jgi:hypothetical protein